MTKWQEYKELYKYLRCRIFHRKHRKRTGNRRIGQVSISYELKCGKCGNTDRELVLFLTQ